MAQGREYWSGHVQAWRSGEQTRAAYCEQHDLSYGAMGYWVCKLRRERDGCDGAADGALVEIETVPVREYPIWTDVGSRGSWSARTEPVTDRESVADSLEVTTPETLLVVEASRYMGSIGR